MKIGFVLTSGDPTGYVAGEYLVESIRRVMPDVPIVQITDDVSPPIVGVDVWRYRPPGPVAFAEFIAGAYASLEHGDWLYLDTDTVVQRDVRDVFDRDFDFAIADRSGTYLDGEADSSFMRRMPYNGGVVFARDPRIWSAIAGRIAILPPKDRRWLGVQLALASLVTDGAFRAAILPAAYNFPPRSADDPIVDKAIVHYKGPWRKKLLFRRIYQEWVCASA